MWALGWWWRLVRRRRHGQQGLLWQWRQVKLRRRLLLLRACWSRLSSSSSRHRGSWEGGRGGGSDVQARDLVQGVAWERLAIGGEAGHAPQADADGLRGIPRELLRNDNKFQAQSVRQPSKGKATTKTRVKYTMAAVLSWTTLGSMRPDLKHRWERREGEGGSQPVAHTHRLEPGAEDLEGHRVHPAEGVHQAEGHRLTALLNLPRQQRGSSSWQGAAAAATAAAVVPAVSTSAELLSHEGFRR